MDWKEEKQGGAAQGMSPTPGHCLAGKAFEMLPRHEPCVRLVVSELRMHLMVSELHRGEWSRSLLWVGQLTDCHRTGEGASLRASWW